MHHIPTEAGAKAALVVSRLSICDFFATRGWGGMRISEVKENASEQNDGRDVILALVVERQRRSRNDLSLFARGVFAARFAGGFRCTFRGALESCIAPLCMGGGGIEGAVDEFSGVQQFGTTLRRKYGR